MKVTFLQFALAGSILLLAVLWMRAVLLYTVLICTLLISSWLAGLLLYLQFSQGPAVIDGLHSACDNKQSFPYGSKVCLFLLQLVFFINLTILTISKQHIIAVLQIYQVYTYVHSQ